jgi:cytochrome o ubiquinol oxidase subunit 1
LAARVGFNHPLGLLLCVALPMLLGLALYVVPLQVGSPTVAFPRAAAAALWCWMLASVLYGVAVAANGAYGGENLKTARLGAVSVALLCVALLVAAVCVAVTVLNLRPAGMTIGRVPFFAYSMLVSATIWVLTLPVVLAPIVVWLIRPASAGDYSAGAFNAIEWLFHQPSVYLAAIPLLGLLADAVVVAAGARHKSAGVVQTAIGALGLFAFGAWAQGDVARETLVWVLFAIAAALPVLVVLASSADVIRRGKLTLTPGLLLAMVGTLLLLFAALAGAFVGANTATSTSLSNVKVGGFVTDQGPGLATGQYYLVIAAAFATALGGLWLWGSRIAKGGLPKGLGMLAAVVVLLGGAAFGFGHLILGLATPDADGAKVLLIASGAGAAAMAVASLLGFLALLGALSGKGSTSEDASDLTGGTLEWLTASPAAEDNFSEPLPLVESPYPLFDQKGIN